MISVMKLLIAVLAIAALFLLLPPRLSYADSTQNCYNHTEDHSDFCYCYRHPKQCNGEYRKQHPDWNRHPSWYHEANNGSDQYHHHHHHPNGYNGEHYQGTPPNQGNNYQQQYH